MEILRKYWPTAFQVNKGDVASLIVKLVILIIACGVIGWLIGLLSHLWIIGVIFGLLGALLEIYCVVGIVLSVLRFLGTL